MAHVRAREMAGCGHARSGLGRALLLRPVRSSVQIASPLQFHINISITNALKHMKSCNMDRTIAAELSILSILTRLCGAAGKPKSPPPGLPAAKAQRHMLQLAPVPELAGPKSPRPAQKTNKLKGQLTVVVSLDALLRLKWPRPGPSNAAGRGIFGPSCTSATHHTSCRLLGCASFTLAVDTTSLEPRLP